MRNIQQKDGENLLIEHFFEMLTSRTHSRLTLQNIKLKSKTRPHTERKVILQH